MHVDTIVTTCALSWTYLENDISLYFRKFTYLMATNFEQVLHSFCNQLMWYLKLAFYIDCQTQVIVS